MTAFLQKLQVSPEAYAEIKASLLAADPGRVWRDGSLNVDGLALTLEGPNRQPPVHRHGRPAVRPT